MSYVFSITDREAFREAWWDIIFPDVSPELLTKAKSNNSGRRFRPYRPAYERTERHCGDDFGRRLEVGGSQLDTVWCRMMNDPRITGAEVPPEAKSSTKIKTRHPNLRKVPLQHSAVDGAIDEPTEAPPIVPPPEQKVKLTISKKPITRLAFTGGMGVGKDYVALACGAQVIGLADPLYALVGVLFPGVLVNSSVGKDIPGVREMLQTLGQWGRGDVEAKYPLTPTRALMVQRIRELDKANAFSSELCVDWSTFGTNKDIWLDSLLDRAKRLDPNRRIAVTNVRFENEFKRLQADGWTHCHIMCSSATRQDRLRKIGVTLSGPAVTDTSERLAVALDQDVAKRLKAPGSATRLRVVWTDTAPSPSSRLYSLNQFLQELAIGEVNSGQQPMNME